jgi:hypothetical protein
MNARQRREAAEFVAAGGSFQTYTPRDRLLAMLLRLFGRGRPPVGRWSP